MDKPLLNTIRSHKLGLLVLDARTAAGKTMEMTASQAGIAAADLQAYENGEKVLSLPEIEALAYVLDTPLDHFWGNRSLSEGKADSSRSINPKLLLVRQKMISSFLTLKRDERKMTITELSQISGVAEENVRAYENADVPIPLYDLEALAKALGISISELFEKRGAIAEWRESRQGVVPATNLPPDLQDFVGKPINRPFLELAKKFSEMPVEKLRAVAESILEITY